MTTAPRMVVTPASAVGLSLLAAWLLVARPPFAAGLALVILGVLILALGYYAPATRVLVYSVLGISATVNLIRRVEVGPMTGYAWLTGLITVSAVILALALPTSSLPAPSRRVLTLMSIFPAWALLSVSLKPPTQSGLQNILVYVGFASIATVSAVATATGAIGFASLRRAFFWTFSAASALYGASLVLDGMGGTSVVDARAYAVFAAIGVAWTAALARYGYRPERRLALAMVALAFLSLSRTGFAVALFVCVIALVGFDTPRKLGRTVAVLGVVAVLGTAAVIFTNPFAARFSEPDRVTLPGGVEVSVSGRQQIWKATWSSALSSPLVGQGAGSAELAVAAVSSTAGHPHNDYLRVFHDFGLVGVAFLLVAIASPIAAAARSLRSAPITEPAVRALHLASILAAFGLALEMITDNSLVYEFVVAPTAVIIGASLGTRATRADARRVSVAPRRNGP